MSIIPRSFLAESTFQHLLLHEGSQQNKMVLTLEFDFHYFRSINEFKMARIVFSIIALSSCVVSTKLARRVDQSLVERSTYVGGWPLAAVPCPSDAPVQCSTGISDQINQQCCPSGNTCIGWEALVVPVCCPTSKLESLFMPS
jgi:hypothetical protein